MGEKKRQRWRLVVAVLAGLVVLCVGVPAGAAALWFVRGTAEAGQGEASPSAAVNRYLLALSSGEDLGVRAIADDEAFQRWQELRDLIARTDPAPSKLEVSSVVEGQGAGDEVAVVAEVRAVWWMKDGSGLSMQGTVHPWQFQTREDDGWKVTAVEPYAWCGGHVRQSACR